MRSLETEIPIFGTAEAAARFWVFIFGLWIVCAVVNIGMADLKERNPVLWGIIVCFFAITNYKYNHPFISIMGIRGLIRDVLGIYIGFRFLISPVIKLSISELVLSGFIIFGFSFWFTLERVGILK